MDENKNIQPVEETTPELNEQEKLTLKKHKKHKMVSYAKYGYLFLIPFFVIFLIFQFLPLCETFYYSFFRYYMNGLEQVGPTPIGFKNFATILSGNSKMWSYLGNTLIIWIIGFIPQVITSLLLAIWFTDSRLKIKGVRFFQTITYMPNLVMAAAFGYMFLMLFSQGGPVNQILMGFGWISEPVRFMQNKWAVRIIVSAINWLMWFGNTSILLMSGIMGIDESVFESARLDGANSTTVFWKITLPLLMPIFVYFVITSMIGGIQLFDAPEIFTQSNGGPQEGAKTIMMYLYNLITSSQNYGMAGAVSVFLFVVTAILSFIVFKIMIPNPSAEKAEKRAYKRRMRFLRSIQREEAKAGGLAR